MNIMILGNMADLQTGLYIVNSAEELGHEVGFVDIRKIVTEAGVVNGQKVILEKIKELDFNPELIIVLKGLEMSYTTTKAVKDMYPKATFTNWFFDVYIANAKIWENDKYHNTLRLFDFYMCSLEGVADNLKKHGFENAVHIGEACYPPLHGEQYINNFQVGKYGSDVAFIGSVGMTGIHKNRVEFLSKIAQAGFDLKIWGDIVGEPKSIPLDIRECRTGVSALNETHSQVCQSSLINIGIDQDTTLKNSWSARIYRIICAGGLYLSTPTRGIQKVFKTNGLHDEITSDQEIVIFYSEEDLVHKLDFLLENDKIRESIAKNGQKKVLAEHTFKHRINEIIQLIENGRNKR